MLSIDDIKNRFSANLSEGSPGEDSVCEVTARPPRVGHDGIRRSVLRFGARHGSWMVKVPLLRSVAVALHRRIQNT